MCRCVARHTHWNGLIFIMIGTIRIDIGDVVTTTTTTIIPLTDIDTGRDEIHKWSVLFGIIIFIIIWRMGLIVIGKMIIIQCQYVSCHI